SSVSLSHAYPPCRQTGARRVDPRSENEARLFREPGQNRRRRVEHRPSGEAPPARLEQGRLADAALGPHDRHETATVSELLAERARDLLDPALDDDDVVGSLLRISLGERPLDYDRIVHPEGYPKQAPY